MDIMILLTPFLKKNYKYYFHLSLQEKDIEMETSETCFLLGLLSTIEKHIDLQFQC
jgi:hypothetical protein